VSCVILEVRKKCKQLQDKYNMNNRRESSLNTEQILLKVI